METNQSQNQKPSREQLAEQQQQQQQQQTTEQAAELQKEKDKSDMLLPNQGEGFMLSNTGSSEAYVKAKEELEREKESLRNPPTRDTKNKWVGAQPQQQRGIGSSVSSFVQEEKAKVAEESQTQIQEQPLRGVREDLDKGFKREETKETTKKSNKRE